MRLRDSVIIGIILSLIVAVGACNKRPKTVLSEDKMVDLMADLQMADAYYSVTPGGKNKPDKKVLVTSILKKHGVTQEQFDSTTAYYGRNIDEYYRLYDKVADKIRKTNGMANGQRAGNTASAGQDIWPYSKFATLFENQTTDGLTFSMPASDIKPGTVLEWRMRLSSAQGVDAMLGVEYENGKSSTFKKSASGNRSFSIPVQTDTSMAIKRVFGVLTVPRSGLPLWVDSISLAKIDFDSLSYSKIRQQRSVSPPAPKKVETDTATKNNNIPPEPSLSEDM